MHALTQRSGMRRREPAIVSCVHPPDELNGLGLLSVNKEFAANVLTQRHSECLIASSLPTFLQLAVNHDGDP
jgi:hypothetical protein